jgi:cell wall/surface repeat protein
MVEKKNGVVPVSKKVAASVLAGIMATGMVPAAAFAEGTATDTSSDSNVELQAEDDDVELQLKPDEAFSAGKVTFHKKDNSPIDINIDAPHMGTLPTDLLKANKDSYVKIVIDEKTNTTLKLTYDEESGKLYDKTKFDETNKKDLFYSFSYKNDSNITVSEDTVRHNAGDYKLVISATDGAYKGGVAAAKFSVTGTSIDVDTTHAYNKESGVADDFTYNAEPQKIAFKTTGGKVLENDQYVVQYFKEGADTADPAQALPSTPVDAGKYVAKLTPRDGVTFKAKLIPFTIKQLDLSDTAHKLGAQFSTSLIVGADTPINSKVQLVSVNGSTALASRLQAVDWVKDPIRNPYPVGKDFGKYQAKLTAKDPADKNFKRDADGILTGLSNNYVYRVAYATSMEYNGNPMDGQSINIDRDLTDWNRNLIKARDENGIVQTPSEFSIFNVRTGTLETSATADIPRGTDGEYIVTALWHNTDTSADPNKPNEYKYGAAATMRVTVSTHSVDADTNAIVTFKQQKDGDPVVTNAIKTTYDGTDIIKRIGYSIRNGKDASGDPIYLVEGPDKDFTVDFTDSKGNVVTSIKDAGTYTLTFKSKKYFIKNPSVPITIEPAKIQAIMPFRMVPDPNDPTKKISQPIAKDSIGNGQSSVVVAPGEVFIRYNDGEKDTNGDLVWKDLPADAVVKITNSKGEAVKKFDKADTYKISVTKPSANDTNMEITAPEMTVTATDKVNSADFLDVINPANYTGSDPLPWYCKEVYKAKELGYVHGHSGSSGDVKKATLFKPEDNLTRAQFAQILFNMAGAKANETVKGLEHEEKGTFRTDFSDCDDSAWYAKAVAWAHSVHIVQGYGDTGEYKPDQSISRQEVATMLSRYEKYVAPAQYKSGEGTSLSSYLDSFAVDGWAESSVKWAVANKVMGVGTNLLNPRNDITRAEVAAMAVRAQPNKLAGA